MLREEDVQQLLETLKHLMRLNNRHPRKFKMKIMLFINMEVISVEYWIMWLTNKLLMKILDSALERYYGRSILGARNKTHNII